MSCQIIQVILTVSNCHNWWISWMPPQLKIYIWLCHCDDVRFLIEIRRTVKQLKAVRNCHIYLFNHIGPNGGQSVRMTRCSSLVRHNKHIAYNSKKHWTYASLMDGLKYYTIAAADLSELLCIDSLQRILLCPEWLKTKCCSSDSKIARVALKLDFFCQALSKSNFMEWLIATLSFMNW